ncbi:hypothetical protein [Escherichia fergusonii]|uniref:hypothetical protein n=1 Tax=Escherichia fergusonii TaxID=564 RepID=UPI0006144CE3|nr:hypothetical protein [Escherichia fergusonii]EHG6158780.1 hypothetical protein [Escherichia fergusonii]EHG6167778.1 hypothetical protein [Escherichia fergusonii]EHK3066851.1 hypothetical protein [Escherichia fergusonii]EHK3071745.1 hypothetical protein [Escherichia fergusonii]EIQ6795566.1 hypothetical protein [Escherichia fergusonii]
MSKKYIILCAAICCLLGMGAALVYHHLRFEHTYKEECSISMVVYHKNVHANITLNFMYSLEKQQGVVAVSGNYLQDDKPKGIIRRDVSYDWTENQDVYHLHSTKIDKYEGMETLPDALLASILPDFYVYPNENVSYSILNQGERGFLFTIGKRPLFYCAR